MGRGKGRAKGIDVTKHIFQPTGPSDLISVRITPAEVIHVVEDDLSPTEGTVVAFALKREGRMEAPVKLCANWRQGACHSFAACNNAHVKAYFDSPVMPTVGNANANTNANTNATPLGSPVQRAREDWGHLTLQQQQQQQPQQQQQQQHHSHHSHSNHLQQQQQQQPNSNSSDTARVSDYKTSATISHSTPIPVPRSQQVNRQTPTTGGSPAVMSTPNTAPQWSRKVLGNSIQQGNYPQQYSMQKQLQPHEMIQQQYVVSQTQGSWGGGQRGVSDDINWATPNSTPVVETFLEAASHKQHGKNELTNKDIHYGSSNKNNTINTSGNNTNNNNNNNINSINNVFACSDSGNGIHLTGPENPTGVLVDSLWTSSGLEQNSVCDSTWCVGGSDTWDLHPSGMLAGESTGGITSTPPRITSTVTPVTMTATTTRALSTGVVTGDGTSLYMGNELNVTNSVASRGDLWGSLSVSNNITSMGSSNKNTGIASPSETLKNQLLRELVGASTDTPNTSSIFDSLRGESRTLMQSTSSFSHPDSGKTASELFSLLGASEERTTASSVTSTQLQNAPTIEELLLLLTTEGSDGSNR